MPRFSLLNKNRSAVLFCALALLVSASRPVRADDDEIQRDQIIPKAQEEFKKLHQEVQDQHGGDPRMEKLVQETEDNFMAHAQARLANPPYQKVEFDYISRSLKEVLIPAVKKMMDIASDNSLTGDQKKSKFDAARDDAKSAGEALYTTMQADAKPAGTGKPQDANKPLGPDGKIDLKKSDVVILFNESIPRSRPGPGGNTGGTGGGTSNNTGGTGDSSSPGGAPGGGTGASSNGGSSNPSDLSQYVAPAGAELLAQQSGNELDRAQYAQAGQDARSALSLDPKNKQALTVSHFSAGRTDGVSSGALPGKELKGDGANGPGGGAAGGGSSGGGTGGFAGGSASGGFGGGSANGGLSGGAGSSSGSLGLSAGAAPAAQLAGMSGAQAQKAAQSALSMGDLGGAMAFVNRALAQDPHNASLLNLRSSIYAGQHDYKHALEDAKAGLLIDPKNPALLRSLGFAQLRDKDYAGALATANEMLELNPNDPYAYAIRGHAYGSMGDRDAMMADLQRAAELDPSFAAAAAKMGGQLQLPSDKDVLFLFPGEEAAGEAKTAAPAGRGRKFGLLVGASALGGLLLALGLLATVLAPLKEQLTSAFTRITRTGPTLGAVEDEDAGGAASVNGLMPGLIRGQYEVSRQIGVGGMGVVYAGTDRSLGRPVAIKKMREELRDDAREKARFVAEAKTVAALHHPNIVDIYAIAEDAGDVYLVFEYVDGKTVHELLQAGGKLEPERASKIVRASADALEYAHGRGVIHRDMKPSNVMLDRSGAIKVMDFGIARMAKDTLLRQSMTNTVVGTPPYMAPEQEQGHVRKESDVYALAICAYEILSGKLPFAGIGAGMLLNKMNMRFAPLSSEAPGLPAGLDAVFERAFQADPDRRYRTPREFADALDAVLPAAARAG